MSRVDGSRVEDEALLGATPGAVEVLYRQFSCPQEARDGRLPEAVAVLQGRQLAMLLLARYRTELARVAPGVADLVSRWTERTDFSTAWDVVFGDIFDVLRTAPADAVMRVAVPLALRLAAVARLDGRWQGEVDRRQPLRWDRWALGTAERLVVESDGDRAVVSLQEDGVERAAAFSWTPSGWHGTGAEELPCVPLGGGELVLLGTDGLRPGWPDGPVARADARDPDVVSACHAGAARLEREAPLYGQWVGRLARQVLVVQAEEARLRSGSSSDLPGVVYLSLPQPPASVGEMLVHEATHQYYHLATRIGPVDDGTDTNLYYSPAVGRPRPLSRILVAFHAFANVALFYRSCLCGGGDGSIESKLEALTDDLRTLAGPLDGNPGLTAIGRALFEPLAARLRDTPAV